MTVTDEWYAQADKCMVCEGVITFTDGKWHHDLSSEDADHAPVPA